MKPAKQSYKRLAVFCLVLVLAGCQNKTAGNLVSNKNSSPLTNPIASPENAETEELEGTINDMQQLEIKIGQASYTVTLARNKTAEAFVKLLPLRVNMQELNGNEKYTYLSQSLPGKAQTVSQIHTGDLMLFGADCLVLFYEDFTTTYRYTKIGHVEDATGLAETLGEGAVRVTFQIPNLS